MHPDAIIAGLRRELERLDKSAEDFAERAKAIEAEITHTDSLDRPEVLPEEPETVVDTNVGYLEGLRKELSRVDKSAAKAVQAEIARVEAEIAARRDQPAPAVEPEPAPEPVQAVQAEATDAAAAA